MQKVALIGAYAGLLIAFCAGCLVGQGDGWVMGGMWVENCRDGEPLGESSASMEEFDLDVDFFSGQVQEDSNKSADQRRNSLTLRIQNTSNNLEVSDGLVFQFNDLDLAARSFASGVPLEVTSTALCTTGCPLQDSLRGNLYLYSSCPDGRQPLVASSYSLEPSQTDSLGSGDQCLLHNGGRPPQAVSPTSCPALTAEEKSTLDQLCAGDFKDRGAYQTIGDLFGEGACMYLCEFGKASAGQDTKELLGFRVNYGDRVAAVFATAIVDGRAVKSGGCARASGFIRGMFTFEVARGRAAQAFP